MYGGGVIENHGKGRIKNDIQGYNNSVKIGKGCVLNKPVIHVRGDNNKIVFEDGCIVMDNCSYWMEGNNITIHIGKNTSFNHHVHFCAQEDHSSIIVGEDCMFANTITVRTSDSHPIYDGTTGRRINPNQNILIGNHVWVAVNSRIMKGAIINDGAIIGSDTIVTAHEIPAGCLAVGHPAKVVKNNIRWERTFPV